VARGVCAVAADGMLAHVTEVTGVDRAAEGGFRAPGPDGERRLTGDGRFLSFWGFDRALPLLREVRGLSRRARARPRASSSSRMQ
jgi:hypothetical protein